MRAKIEKLQMKRLRKEKEWKKRTWVGPFSFNKLLKHLFNYLMFVDILSPNLFGYLMELYVCFWGFDRVT